MSEEDLENIGETPDEEGESETSPQKKAAIIIGIVIAAIVLVGAYLYLKREPAGETEGEKKEDVVVSVKTAKAEKGPIAREISAVGTASAAPVSPSGVSSMEGESVISDCCPRTPCRRHSPW